MSHRWGIAGTGQIAAGMAAALATVDDAELVAVGSRSTATAAGFAERWSIPHAGTYDDLVTDPDVDVVYVATPHHRHAADTIAALEAGRHVLCEKAFSLNADQAIRMVEAARRADRFLMEGMWTRFQPATVALRRLLDEGAVGEVRTLEADFSLRHDGHPDDRHLSPHLAGGALLDKGVYPVSFGWHLLGPPTSVAAHGRVGPTGVDVHVGGMLGHHGGAVTLYAASLESTGHLGARIVGTDGHVEVAAPFWCTNRFVVHRAGAGPVEHTFADASLAHEARHVHECIDAGLAESPVLPLDESVAIMHCLDEIRRQLGLRYPEELTGPEPDDPARPGH